MNEGEVDYVVFEDDGSFRKVFQMGKKHRGGRMNYCQIVLVEKR